MKHNSKIVASLVILFLVSQIVGLGLLAYITEVSVAPTGEINVVHGDTVIGPRPEVSGADSFLLVIFSVLLGTGLILLLIRLGLGNMWKGLFFFAVFMTIFVSLGVFLESLIAFAIAIILALVKIFKPNIILHNFTEILIYSGIALIFVPIFNVEWIIALLLAISVYDFIAVFKSKHMISIAKFQTDSRVFAGLSIPYKVKMPKAKVKEIPSKTAKKMKQAGTSIVKTVREREETVEAILGGGDIAFPLIFAGVVMSDLIVKSGLTRMDAFLKVLIIPIVVSIFLLLLFIKGKKGKYYPAMPFLTAGSLLGMLIVWLI